jgi:hypothetical protein
LACPLNRAAVQLRLLFQTAVVSLWCEIMKQFFIVSNKIVD